MNREMLKGRLLFALYESDNYVINLFNECRELANGDTDIIDMVIDYYNKFSTTATSFENIDAAFKYNLQQKFGYRFASQFRKLADALSRVVYIENNIRECHCGELYKNCIHYDGTLLADYLLDDFIKTGTVKHLVYPSELYSAVYQREDFEDRFIYKDCYIIELLDDYLILKPNQFEQLFALV